MGNLETSLPYQIENDDNCDILNEFWTVKKCSYNGFNKNAILFSYEDKSRSKGDYSFALNQIKVIDFRLKLVINWFNGS